MGEVNKLLAEIEGVPMVVRAVDAAVASGADPVLVVTGHEEGKIRAALAGRSVRFVNNGRTMPPACPVPSGRRSPPSRMRSRAR